MSTRTDGEFLIPTVMPTRVRFTGQGGWPMELKRALSELEVGKVYVINSLNVGRSSSTVDISEETQIPVGTYNAAMFEFLAWGIEL